MANNKLKRSCGPNVSYEVGERVWYSPYERPESMCQVTVMEQLSSGVYLVRSDRGGEVVAGSLSLYPSLLDLVAR